MRPLSESEQEILIAAMADYLTVLRDTVMHGSDILATAELLSESIAYGLIVYDDDN